MPARLYRPSSTELRRPVLISLRWASLGGNPSNPYYYGYPYDYSYNDYGPSYDYQSTHLIYSGKVRRTHSWLMA